MYEWSTCEVPPAERLGAWEQALSASHLGWQLSRHAPTPMEGRIRQMQVGPATLVECSSSRCAGQRDEKQIAQLDQAYFGFLFVSQGSELVSDGRSEQIIGPGQSLIWNSQAPYAFRVIEPLHKITAFIPRDAFRQVVRNPEQHVGAVNSGGLSNFLGGLLSSMLDAHSAMTADEAADVMSMAMEGMARLARKSPAGATLPATLLRSQIEAYIDRKLGDADLTPERIARAHGISVRYLHLLFSQSELSVSRRIKKRRLERCRSALQHAPGKPITQIAYEWGFNDSALFSRSFKAQFGCSPREFRKRLNRSAPGHH